MSQWQEDITRLRDAGRTAMARSSVAVCGLARDCADSLSALIPQIEALSGCFGRARIIVVENDSSDETGSVLSRWNQRNPAVRAVQFCYRNTTARRESGGPGSGWFGAARMQRMAFARNQYLEALSEEKWPDFVVIIDLDIRSFSLAGVEHSFGLREEWDIVTANGARYSLRNPLRASVYWDSYAYEPAEGFPGGVQTPQQIRRDQTAVARKLRAGRLLPARSAFGGLGIYDASLLREHRYSVMENACEDVPVLCDHPTLHRAIRAHRPDLRLMINPRMKVNYGSALQLAKQASRRITG